MTSALQIEFPLSVAVCAWCEPVKRGGAAGRISHGICPRHFRKLQQELQGTALKRRSRRLAAVPAESLLPL